MDIAYSVDRSNASMLPASLVAVSRGPRATILLNLLGSPKKGGRQVKALVRQSSTTTTISLGDADFGLRRTKLRRNASVSTLAQSEGWSKEASEGMTYRSSLAETAARRRNGDFAARLNFLRDLPDCLIQRGTTCRA